MIPNLKTILTTIVTCYAVAVSLFLAAILFGAVSISGGSLADSSLCDVRQCMVSLGALEPADAQLAMIYNFADDPKISAAKMLEAVKGKR